MAFTFLEWKWKEVVWVVVVVGLVAGVSKVQLSIGQMKARDAQRKADAELVGRALAAFLEEHQALPQSSLEGKIVSCGGKNLVECEWGGENFGDSQGEIYLKQIPRDPWHEKGRHYLYRLDESGQKYRVYVALENQRDEAFKRDLTEMCGMNVQCNWYVEN